MASRLFEERRAEILERVRQHSLPESVAHLLVVVQEPRCDGEPSSEEFDACLTAEVGRLRVELDEAQRFVANGAGKAGGVVEAESSKAARTLLAAAEAAGMPKAAQLLRSALGRCAVIPQRSPQLSSRTEFPQPVRVIDPETGRPIGLWR